MTSAPGDKGHLSKRNRRSTPGKVPHGGIELVPPDFASLLKGFYSSVALQLDVDPTHVSRVARGECKSKTVEDALRRKLIEIVRRTSKSHGGAARKGAHKKARKGMN